MSDNRVDGGLSSRISPRGSGWIFLASSSALHGGGTPRRGAHRTCTVRFGPSSDVVVRSVHVPTTPLSRPTWRRACRRLPTSRADAVTRTANERS